MDSMQVEAPDLEDPKKRQKTLKESGKVNPNAPDQLALDILQGFRRKVFGILTLQCMLIWGLATGIAYIPAVRDREILVWKKDPTDADNSKFYMDCAIVGSVWFVAIISLCVVSRYRYKWPQNFASLLVFSVLISAAIGLACGVNVVYGLLLAFCSIVFVAVPSCITVPFSKPRMIEVLPVSICGAFLTFIIGLIGWQAIVPEIDGLWVVLALFLNCLGMCWLGYEMDWICSRLEPDEYLLPICLVWAEIIASLLIVLVVVIAGDCGACDPGCCAGGTYLYCHCDCWLYGYGDSSRAQYFRKKMEFATEQQNQQSQQGSAMAGVAPSGEVATPQQEAMKVENDGKLPSSLDAEEHL